MRFIDRSAYFTAPIPTARDTRSTNSGSAASASRPSASSRALTSAFARESASSNRSTSFTVSPLRVLNFLPSSPNTRPNGTCSSETPSGAKPAFLEMANT